MLRNSFRIFSSWVQASMEWLCVAPLLLLAGIYFVPAPSVGWWFSFFPLMIFVGLLLKIVWPDAKRFVFIAVLWVISFGGSFLLVNDVLLILVTSIVGTVFAIRGALYLERSQEELFPIPVMWFSVAIYFVSYFIFTYVERFEGYGAVVTWLGVVFVVMILLQSNKSHLRAETSIEGKETSLYTPLKWKNRMFILLTVIVILLIVNFRLVQGAFQRLIDILAYFISKIPSPFGSEDGPREIAPTLPFMPDEGEAAGTSIFQMILYGLGYVIATVAVLYMAYLLVKNMGRLLKYLFGLVKKIFHQLLDRMEQTNESKSYIDEKESMIDWKEWGSDLANRAKERLSTLVRRKESWNKLTNNRDKVRFLYREFLSNQIKLGYDVKKYKTVKEVIGDLENEGKLDLTEAEKLERVYSLAKYSNSTIEDAEVEAIKEIVEKK